MGKGIGFHKAAGYEFQKEEVESVMWMELGECIEAVRHHRIPNCIYLDELEMLERYLSGKQRG